MMRKTTFVLTAVGVLLVASRGFAGKFNEVVDIGDKAANWTNLAGVDDKLHSFADYDEKQLVLQIFTCNHCPVALAYEDRIIQLQKDYADKGVQVIAININNSEADKLPKMKERAEEKGFNFPYVYDPSQKSGREMGAAVTPHVFLLDKDRHIAYMGAIDDNMDTSRVTKHYVREAIDAVLAGEKVRVNETKQFGCGIQWDRVSR